MSAERTPTQPTADQATLRQRPIRSFVLRQGRLSPAQERALDALMPRYGVPYREATLDWPTVFGRTAPVVLEIGCGMGETTAAIALAQPGTDFLGVEVHGPGVGALLNRIEAAGLANLRVVRHDAVEVVRDMVPRDSLAGIHVYFPDPWPKKRHHKRRLLQPPFVRTLAERLAPGGYLHVATDWAEYADDATLGPEGTRAAPCPYRPIPPTCEGKRQTVYRFGVPAAAGTTLDS